MCCNLASNNLNVWTIIYYFLFFLRVIVYVPVNRFRFSVVIRKVNSPILNWFNIVDKLKNITIVIVIVIVVEVAHKNIQSGQAHPNEDRSHLNVKSTQTHRSNHSHMQPQSIMYTHAYTHHTSYRWNVCMCGAIKTATLINSITSPGREYY